MIKRLWIAWVILLHVLVLIDAVEVRYVPPKTYDNCFQTSSYREEGRMVYMYGCEGGFYRFVDVPR